MHGARFARRRATSVLSEAPAPATDAKELPASRLLKGRLYRRQYNASSHFTRAKALTPDVTAAFRTDASSPQRAAPCQRADYSAAVVRNIPASTRNAPFGRPRPIGTVVRS